MGTWGTAIFSDDLAADVRDAWRGLIGDGLPPDDATGRMLTDFAASVHDPDERGVFWLALAVAQWQTGRLADTVRDTAVEIIDSGVDLDRWPTTGERTARTKVLAKARAQLLSPQPAPKRLPKPVRSATPYRPGDVIGYRHDSGATFLLWVIANQSDLGGEYSQVEVLDVVGEPLPDPSSVVRLPVMPTRPAPADGLGFVLIAPSTIPAGRGVVLATVARPAGRPVPTLRIVHVRELDDWLRPFLPDGDHVPRRQVAT